jgi:hypothetical protein
MDRHVCSIAQIRNWQREIGLEQRVLDHYRVVDAIDACLPVRGDLGRVGDEWLDVRRVDLADVRSGSRVVNSQFLKSRAEFYF